MLAIDGNSKAGTKSKSNKGTSDKRSRGEKVAKNGRVIKANKSHRQEKLVDDRYDTRKERKRERSREKKYKRRKSEDKYFEEREQNDMITSGKT